MAEIQPAPAPSLKPGIIFDTDMGNDIDDALAQVAMLSGAADGLCVPLMVGSSNSNEWAVPGIRAINNYYGHAEIPAAKVCGNAGLALGKFTKKIAESAGLSPQPEVEAPALMRKILSQQPDKSVRVVATGFSTNLAALLETGKNHQNDGIQLTGKELVEKKVEFAVLMAGNYANPGHAEFNVAENVPAFKKVIEEWGSPIYLSGYEIGERVLSRGELLKTLLKENNPAWMGYAHFFESAKENEKWDRPSWDQTAMLWAMKPNIYFDLSGPVEITLSEKGNITWKAAADSKLPRQFFRFSAEYPPKKMEAALAVWYRDK